MKPTPFYQFRLPPERPGAKPKLTRWRMTIAHAAQYYPGATPDLATLEMRYLPEGDDIWTHNNTSPPAPSQPSQWALDNLPFWGEQEKRRLAREQWEAA